MAKSQVVTGLVRFSYVNIFRSRAFTQDGTAKYSICLLIPKKDTKTLAKIKKAIEDTKLKGQADKWGGKIPKNLHLPLRDGDEERADEAPEYAGMYFLNASANEKPGIVDENGNEILDPAEVYSGCWGRAGFNLFAYDSNGNRGIGVGLNTIQKLKDDEHLGGARATAEEDFGDDFDDDEEDFC